MGRSPTNVELAKLDDEVERLAQHRSAPRMRGPPAQLDPSAARNTLRWDRAEELAHYVVETLSVLDGG